MNHGAFADLGQSRQANMLKPILLITMMFGLGFAAIMAILLPENIVRAILIAASCVLMMLLSSFLLSRGKTGIASGMFLFIMWLMITTLSATGGGTEAPAFIGYIIIVLSTGLLLGIWWGIFVSIICTITEFGIIYAQLHEMLPPSVVQQTIYSQTIAQMIYFAWVMVFVFLYKKSIDSALEQAELELEVRRETERKRSESEARFRTTFESAGIGIALVDMQGIPIQTNPALQRILGYSDHEFRKMPFTEFTHPDDRERDWHLYTELIEGKRDTYRIEKKYIRKDGQIVWGMLTVSLVADLKGKPLYAIGMLEDITDRKNAGPRVER
ncbi:MAG TPA: PAS domain S-box protein [Bacteroidota bacterium]|nr:PAS domain S-box protein [Bacteroidota bacterium]